MNPTSTTDKAEKELKHSIPEETTFLDFLCFTVDSTFRRLPEAERQEAVAEFSQVLERQREDIQLRFYTTMGLRADCDFYLWGIAKDLAPFQAFSGELMKTKLGSYLTLTYTFVSLTRPSQYNPGHIAAFESGGSPLKYLFLYPFVKSREWYLLDFDTRRKLMSGHTKIGHMYPMVRLNTTYAFGLGDQDFVLAFETDQPAAFEDLVQRLRETEASRYTVRDTPFIIGQWCPDAATLMKGLAL